MANLLSGLKAEDSVAYNKLVGDTGESEDEDVTSFVERRLSMNVGTDG